MRNLILPAIAAISISLTSSGCLERRLEQDLPRKTVDITQEDLREGQSLAQKLNLSTDGFSVFGVSAIAVAQINVQEKYFLPDIFFIEKKHIDKLSAEADSLFCESMPGVPRSNTENLFEVNVPYWNPYGHYLIVMKNFEEHQKDFPFNNSIPVLFGALPKPIDERFSVPYDKPMVAQVLHNMGHVYFDMIGLENQIDLTLQFQFLDNAAAYNGEKIPGHPSYLSLYSSIPPGFDIDAEYAIAKADEQFAEAFVYHILDHNYKDSDNIFQARLNAVKKSLELFAKD